MRVLLALVLGLSTSSEAVSACDVSPSGAREGEEIEARITRLEMQLRLSKAERAVNRGRR